MSGELALPGEGTLTDAMAQRFIAQMRAVRAQAGACSEDEALKAKRDAEMVRQWARINKLSGEIALEACKLQATAMRRLAQLGSAVLRYWHLNSRRCRSGPHRRRRGAFS